MGGIKKPYKLTDAQRGIVMSHFTNVEDETAERMVDKGKLPRGFCAADIVSCFKHARDRLTPLGKSVLVDLLRTPSLSGRENLILQTLYKHNNTSSVLRITTEALAAIAEGADANADGFKRPVANLKKLGFIGSKSARGGGIWLTDSGLQKARELFPEE